ncbi:MAG: TonB-dependent receptor [Saprospiraceae bacterium]|nr:TonB-dependent receptor [Saprospiraceae bacterium]
MMKKLLLLPILSAVLCLPNSWCQEKATLSGIITNLSDAPLEDVVVYVTGEEELAITDKKGFFSLQLLNKRSYDLFIKSIGIDPLETSVFLDGDTTLQIQVKQNIQNLSEVVVKADSDAFGIRRLRAIEAGGLYEGKKTEVINIEKLIGNKASNNARQAFSKIPSLNIWESDNAGLQLDIGGRGLSPKRTSNFNTRQNGYDISADALGYPESYYTPPLQAVQQIEIVRGAGALQYGSQFGGLVNFKMKQGDAQKRFNFESQNTYGAYQFLNTFNSLHGQVGKLNYYSYFQYKQGDGWRPNSEFEQTGAFLGLNYQASDKLKLQFDLTHMYYLSQQAGGLTDEAFEADPRSSNRTRNWFRVNWNLAALSLTYEVSPSTKIYSRTFGLQADRTSLGLLETPDIEDPLSFRDLIDGQFRNIGNETRVSYSYKSSGDLNNTLLIGTRLYRGFTNFSQSFGTDGSDADFTRVDTAFLDRRKSDFEFPNLNAAFFAEKIIRLSNTFSLIPGIRYEYIDTKSEGYFTSTLRTNSFGDFIEEVKPDSSEKQRHIFLYGLGVSKKLNKRYELYGNATANYRAINFTDVQIQTNTQVVDSLIKDESGFSFDLGIRKRDFSPFFIEAGLFYILYEDRIGEVIDDGLRVRTNIGAAQIFGLELFFELDILAALKKTSDHKLSAFINGSINRGVYTRINDRALVGVRTNNKLEELPDYNIKSGISYGYRSFTTSLQATFVGEQFSDAANTRNAFKGVFGIIPAYTVLDFSAKYDISDTFSLGTSINNLLDASYFTRRAPAYPGPGIIPALGRQWNLTLSTRF